MRTRLPLATLVLASAASLGVVACGSSGGGSGGSSGGRQVTVKLTDAGCEPGRIKLDAGPTTFTVTNAGTGRVSEFEVLDGSRVLGEKENLVAGLKGSFALDLKPGTYTTSCPGGQSTAQGTLEVGGKAVPATNDADLEAASVGYNRYVETQTRVLVTRTAAFVAAVKAGDTAKAKSLFATSRIPYETVEPVAESFGTLDPQIDARVNDVKPGDTWTGFHRIEQTLWQKDTTKGLSGLADELLADVRTLQRKAKGLSYEPEELANGANGLLDEVSSSKITGEEDRYSHTDLYDFEANVSGSQTAFELLAPALRKRDAALTTQIQSAFAAVNAELRTLKTGGAYPSYATVGTAERQRLAGLVKTLAAPLAKVASRLQTA